MKVLQKLLVLAFLATYLSSLSALTSDICLQAHKAYSPYKESFRFFWYSLSKEQQKSLQKVLAEHATIYVASKQKNAQILGQKKINTGILIALGIPSLITLLTGLCIMYLKDYRIANRENRARCAGLGALAVVSFILLGLKKICKGIMYSSYLEQRIKKDQILLQEIEKYEQEINV